MIALIKYAGREVNRYFDFSFLLKFIALFAVFYYANMFFVDLTLPEKSYNAFFVDHFNYINWITGSIMYTANMMTRAVGLDTQVVNIRFLVVPGGHSLFMNWQCVGLGIFSFWGAFVLANKMTWKKKIIWGVGGLIGIWFLNCCRTALLMIALENNWKEWKQGWTRGRTLDHHDLFNYGCYILIIGLIYVFYRKFKNKTDETKG
ncbi:MAG: hypothetical protein IT250_18055 [Chitinophagaceae bacterium]|nr:hypothetical protein [Chitinophagaceae bacterium]